MDFPYPTTIAREDFQQTTFEPDSFLYENHRYTSIDVLIKDLTTLLNDLKGELLNIVNNDYTDFIRLGRSIDGGMDLINSMVAELKDFKRNCSTSESNLTQSIEVVERSLATKSSLIVIKNNIKLCLLLSSQIDNFENLLNASSSPSVTDRGSTVIVDHVNNLTTIYLAINKLYGLLSKLETNYIVGLRVKVSNIGSEFINYLNELLSKYKTDKVENQAIIFELLRIYKVIGHEEVFLKVIKD